MIQDNIIFAASIAWTAVIAGLLGYLALVF
jgi:hypothetical protein